MDTVITGGPGVGKTNAAHKLIADHFGVKTITDTTLRQLLIVDTLALERVDFVTALVRTARVEAVLFDGCITSDDVFKAALDGVKEARVQCGRNIFAVYVRQCEGVLSIVKHPENFDRQTREELGKFNY